MNRGFKRVDQAAPAANERLLIWLRADLRVQDNAALIAACARGARNPKGGAIACFVICPRQWAAHDWAGIKVEFILRTLRELGRGLAAINVPLIVGECATFAETPSVLLTMARERGCTGVVFNREYEWNERRRDDAVIEAFEDAGLSAESFTDQTLVEPGEVRTGGGTYYTVFTPFKRSLYKALEQSRAYEPLGSPKKQAALACESSPIPASVGGFVSHVPADRASELWPAGEGAAMQRLNAFIKTQAASYASARDVPSIDGTSMLSPYLTVGAISVRQCLHAALEANTGRLDAGDPGLVTWISELAWREFYKHILVGFPWVSKGRAFKPETERIRWSDKDEHFQAWCEGRTGVPIVDAAMRQLHATGWMHNRLRMIAAMYLTKDLFIDWRRGERHFMQHLIDGDLASNNGGWQWSASTGTDAAPYFRIFNPVSQSKRVDPAGMFIKRYVPELASLPPGEDSAIHDPEELAPLARATLDYPRPLVDRASVKPRVLEAFKALTR
jgi:deoxyribodipyrimidine photo-lyase